MNQYTRAVHFKNNDSKLITDQEMENIIKNISGGAKFVMIQGELVSVDTIARVGAHHDTAMQQIRNESDLQRELVFSGNPELADARRKMIADKAITHALGMKKADIKKLAGYDIQEKMLLTNKKLQPDEDEQGYYLNEFGEKMYS